MLQHWNLDNAAKVKLFYKGIDNFVRLLHKKCLRNGISLAILSDHGQEQIKESINIKKMLKNLDLSSDEYIYFMEVSSARFWFYTDRARKKIVELLFSIANGRVFDYKEMHQFDIKFDDDQYGEIYFIANPGYIIFPHDFYHPLAGVVFGLKDWQQRGRLFSPKHRGNHGYLPNYDSEKGFMLLLDDGYEAVFMTRHPKAISL
jgi:hypothetical protein